MCRLRTDLREKTVRPALSGLAFLQRVYGGTVLDWLRDDIPFLESDTSIPSLAAAVAQAVASGLTEPLQLESRVRAVMPSLWMDACSGPRCQQLECAAVKFRKCSCCRASKYCSEDCQQAHWNVHKRVCRASSHMQPGAPRLGEGQDCSTGGGQQGGSGGLLHKVGNEAWVWT